MITGWIVGKDELIARFDAMPGRLDQCLLKTMTGLAIDLATFITQNYLDGQAVRRITGTGSRSTRSMGVEQTPDSIIATVRTGGPEAPYMKFLNDGTGPYEILPKNKKALAFMWNGQQVIVKRVQHPGLEGRHFMEDGLGAFAPTIKARLEDAVREAIE